jgi:predicted metal-dependent peptidase
MPAGETQRALNFFLSYWSDISVRDQEPLSCFLFSTPRCHCLPVRRGDRAREEELRPGQRGRLDWRALLRRYAGQVLDVRPIYGRPNRRFPELVGIVPGQGRRATRPKIMAVIDTSGSMTEELLSQMNGELNRLACHHDLVVVECDCKIQRVGEWALQDLNL